MVFYRTPLGQVIADLSRYHRGRMFIRTRDGSAPDTVMCRPGGCTRVLLASRRLAYPMGVTKSTYHGRLSLPPSGRPTVLTHDEQSSSTEIHGRSSRYAGDLP
jgi:hypothetical protein